MSRLDDLQVTIEDMSQDDLLEFIRATRTDRATSKRILKTTTKASRGKAKDQIRDMLAGLSKDEITKLMGGNK